MTPCWQKRYCHGHFENDPVLTEAVLPCPFSKCPRADRNGTAISIFKMSPCWQKRYCYVHFQNDPVLTEAVLPCPFSKWPRANRSRTAMVIFKMTPCWQKQYCHGHFQNDPVLTEAELSLSFSKWPRTDWSGDWNHSWQWYRFWRFSIPTTEWYFNTQRSSLALEILNTSTATKTRVTCGNSHMVSE